jgi:hypothetical protein
LSFKVTAGRDLSLKVDLLKPPRGTVRRFLSRRVPDGGRATAWATALARVVSENWGEAEIEACARALVAWT